MARPSRPARAEPNIPDPETPRRPVRSTAGKGGHLSHLRKVALAIEAPQRPGPEDEAAGLDDPVNLMAPTPRRRARKNKSVRIQENVDVNATGMQVDQLFMDPRPPIMQSSPRGRFGLQPQLPAATYVGTQATEDYDRDRPTSVVHHSSSQRSKSRSSKASSRHCNTTLSLRRADLFDGPLSDLSSNGNQEDLLGRDSDNYEMLYTDVASNSRVGDEQHNGNEEEQAVGQGDGKHGDDSESDDFRGNCDDEEEDLQMGDGNEDKDEDEDEDEDDSEGRRSLPSGALPRPQPVSGPSAPVDGTLNAMDRQSRTAVRRGNERAGMEYDVLDRHHLTNRRRKSPSPAFLTSVRDGVHHGDDRNLKRRRTCMNDENDETDETAAVIPRIRDAAVPVSRVLAAPVVDDAAVPRTRNTAVPIPRNTTIPAPSRMTAAPNTHNVAGAPNHTGAAPRARVNPPSTLQSREDPHATQVTRGNPSSILQSREDPRAVQVTRANAAVPAATLGPEKPRRGKYSKNPKGSVPLDPTKIGFYPKLWAALLEVAKGMIRRSLFHSTPFLHAPEAIEGPCSEVLFQIIARYEEENRAVEGDIWPKYKHEMARLLFGDTQTFRSEVKKIAQEIIPVAYQLTAPIRVLSHNARLQFVKDKAAGLLEGSQYLKGERDSQGRTSHFAHPALKSICLAVYYRNSSKSLRNFDEFQESIPKTAVALVAAYVHSLLTTWKIHGHNVTQPLNSEKLEATYHKVLTSVEQVAKHPYHGPKLEDMLAEWAAAGMDGFVVRAEDSDGDNGEFGGDISSFEDE